MSTASPSRHDRIERHIQRQRGAGVRSLATNFGFSFGLPVAGHGVAANPVTTSHREEPPAKRRKSNALGPAKAEIERVAREHFPGEKSIPESSVHARKRRRFAADEEEAQQSAPAEEDSFVGTQIKRVPAAKPKKDAVQHIGSTEVDCVDVKAPAKKRGRPKKDLNRMKPEAQNELSVKATDCASGIAATAATEGTVSLVSEGAHFDPQQLVNAKPVPKKRGRPAGKAAADASCGWEATASRTENFLDKKSNERRRQDSARHRRQAAANAMSKVSAGYLEEASDITKKRREELPLRASRVKRAAETLASRAQFTREREVALVHHHDGACHDLGNASTGSDREPCSSTDTIQPKTKVPKRSRAPSDQRSDNADEQTTSARVQASEISVPSEQSTRNSPPRRRAKRNAAMVAKTKVLDVFIEEASDISKKRRNPNTAVRSEEECAMHGASSATTGTVTQALQPAEKLSGCAGSSYTAREKAVQRATKGHTDRAPLTEFNVNIRTNSPAKASVAESGKQSVQSVQRRGEQVQLALQATTSKKEARRKHISSATCTDRQPSKQAHSASHSDVGESIMHRTDSTEPRLDETYKAHTLDAGNSARQEATAVSTGYRGDQRKRKRSNLESSDRAAQKANVQDPRIVKDDEEDLDWLAALPSAPSLNNRTQKKVSIMRQKRISAGTDGIDLDDLLSNIASYVPAAIPRPAGSAGVRSQGKPRRHR